MVERSPKPCGISGSAERGGCVTAEPSARTQGLVKRARDHVNNGTSQAQTPGYRAVTAIPPASTRMTDMTCYEKLLSMSIQGSSLHPIIHTVGKVGNCHQLNACELKLLLGIHLSPLPVMQARQCLSRIQIISSSYSLIVFKISHLQQFAPVLFSTAVVRIASREAGSWLVFSAASLPHCVWSVQRPGHPPGQSRGKGVCQKHCPQQTEPSLGTAL